MWAGFSLIGWRIQRRFGWRGEAVFFAVVALVGTLRGFAVAALMPGLIAFSPGMVIALIDMLLRSGLTALAQSVMRLVAGPAAADLLLPRR